MWPASWKSARQSSTPPIGWITSTTRSGTSIGAQNARGDFFSRASTSSSTFVCARMSIPMPESVASSAGSMSSPEKCSSHSGARNRRGMSHRCASSSEMPRRSWSSGSIVSSNRRSVSREDGAALVGELVELEAEAAVELDRVRRAEIANRGQRDRSRLAVDRVHVLLGQLVPRLFERLALQPVGLVRHRRPEHPEADRLAVDRRLERRLEPRDLLGVRLREVREVLVAARSATARARSASPSTLAPSPVAVSSAVSSG